MKFQDGVSNSASCKKKLNPNITTKDYKSFRKHLTSNLGYYCSYCERRIESNIGIEHIKPKTLHPNLELNWLNLLLACVNCNSTKGHKPITIRNYIWPHLDNSANAFIYSTGGMINVAPQLSTDNRKKAMDTIELVGLDKIPSSDININPEESDNRWKFRKEAWDKAEEFSNDLKHVDTPIIRKLIVANAIATGYFSVWLSVFQSDIKMKRDLIYAFSGIDNSCYDPTTLRTIRKGRV